MTTTTERILRALRSNDEIQTPSYIVDIASFQQNIRDLTESFSILFPQFILGYSYKTNYASRIVLAAHELGAYAEVVSPMELKHAQRFVLDNRIIYNGPHFDPLRKYVIAKHGGMANADSIEELEKISQLAQEDGFPVNIGIRINLVLSSGIHSHLGIVLTPEVEERIRSLKYINVVGVHCHVTKSRDLNFWIEKTRKMCEIAKIFKAQYIDLGGNMYGPMNPEFAEQFHRTIPTFNDYAKAIFDVFTEYYGQSEFPTLILEAGTPLISNAMAYLTKVVSIKETGNIANVICNGKSLDVSMIGESGKAFPITVISDSSSEHNNVRFYGCTCSESDYLGFKENCNLDIGDKILIDNVGSYSNVLSPKFIQGVPAMYSLENGILELVKRADSYDDVFGTYLIRGLILLKSFS